MDEISTLHNFYCMAHVLLGFHSYADKNFREQHRKYMDQNIRLGREASGAFLKFKREFPAHRLIRLASNSCGPVGDEKSGVQEKWLAYCRSTGTKSLLQSLLQSYRDNRFNALFETAAQVHRHKQDLFAFLSMLENKNLMLQSVFEDLTDPRARSMVHALAVVYVHITGPYWDLVNSKRVQYLELYIFIQSLADAISRWKEEPMEVLKFRAAQPILPDFPPDTQGPLYSSAMAEPEETFFFCQTLKNALDGILKTILQQLKDFMPGERYGYASAPKELERTTHSSLTNLTCERKFGSLDASQNRRRNATLHYHSTVTALKQHRATLKEYLHSKGDDYRKRLWKTARKGGKFLRNKHRVEEKAEQKIVEKHLKEVHLQFQQKKARMIEKATAARKEEKGKAGAKKGGKQNTAAKKALATAKRRLAAKAALDNHPPEVAEVVRPKENDWIGVAYKNGCQEIQAVWIKAPKDSEAVVVKPVSPRSIEVDTSNGRRKQNRRHLNQRRSSWMPTPRVNPAIPATLPSGAENRILLDFNPELDVLQQPVTADKSAPLPLVKTQNNPTVVITRSGRVVKPPEKMDL
ncbi:hypothetical protein ACOMHN_013150 [Nucella lapillus]